MEQSKQKCFIVVPQVREENQIRDKEIRNNNNNNSNNNTTTTTTTNNNNNNNNK